MDLFSVEILMMTLMLVLIVLTKHSSGLWYLNLSSWILNYKLSLSLVSMQQIFYTIYFLNKFSLSQICFFFITDMPCPLRRVFSVFGWTGAFSFALYWFFWLVSVINKRFWYLRFFSRLPVLHTTLMLRGISSTGKSWTQEKILQNQISY